MSTTPHPRAQLSAYLDGALSAAERSAVDEHLASCTQCPAALADLSATARLIAALPSPAPTRRLAPRIATVPAWLAPLRTLSTIASGISVFLFIASAMLANIGFLASSGATTTSASQAPLLAPGAAALPAPGSPSAGAAFRNVAGASAAAPAAAQDAAKSATSPTPTAASSAVAESTVSSSSVSHEVVQARPVFGQPWIWLVLAIATGALAILLQRRLRRA